MWLSHFTLTNPYIAFSSSFFFRFLLLHIVIISITLKLLWFYGYTVKEFAYVPQSILVELKKKNIRHRFPPPPQKNRNYGSFSLLQITKILMLSVSSFFVRSILIQFQCFVVGVTVGRWSSVEK